MLIDWFTVGAQVLNFLILVWLMKRLLYKPILNAIDEREKRIAAELADADARKADAQKERDTFRQKNEEFDQKRAALLSQATDEASAERQRLIEQAHERANILSAQRQETLRNQARNLNRIIGQRAQHEVFSIARKALMDLAGVSLEERIGEVFIRRLHEADEPAKKRLAEALTQGPDRIRVRSAFELPGSVREAVQDALNEILSVEVPVRFEVAPELVAGVELTANGEKVAWSIEEYLRALEKGVGELLQEEGRPEAKAARQRTSEGPSTGSTVPESEPVSSAKATST